MKNSKFTLETLEKASLFNCKFLHSLHRNVGEEAEFKKSRKLLEDFVNEKTFSSALVDFLGEHKSKIFVEIGKDETAYLRDFFVRLSEEKVTEKDKKYIKKLLLNILKGGEYYFDIFLILLKKIFPPELIDNIKHSLRVGKNLIKIIKLSLADNKYDDFTDFLLKNPLIMGVEHQDVEITGLHSLLYPYGFNTSLFTEIHNILIDSFRGRESNDIVSLMKNTEISNMNDLKNFPFDNFFRPTDRVIKILVRVIQNKASRQKKELIRKDKELDRNDMKVRQDTHQILSKQINNLQSLVDVKEKDLQSVINNTQSSITELEKTLQLHLKHVREHERRSNSLKDEIDDNKDLLNINEKTLGKLIPSQPTWEIERFVNEYHKAISYLNIIDPACEKQIVNLLRLREKDISDKDLLYPIQDTEQRKFYPDMDKVINNYRKVFEEVLEPIYIRKIISGMIEIWPPEIDFTNPKSRIITDKKVHLIGLDLLPNGKFYRFSSKGKIEPKTEEEIIEKEENVSNFLRKEFSSLASVLVYDIRGSTFMAHRLRNAKQQKFILSKFQKTMLDAARNGAPFVLKDTGDGGILWFGSNSKELDRNIYKYRETESGDIFRSVIALEDELGIETNPKSSEMAIKTALNLVRAAEKFVKENYMNYRDWFEEVTEKEIFYDGITYALLPPRFKSLFRLGIGIASGKPDNEITFSSNAFGDLDLTGILVDESAIFSTGRSPERSVIIADHCTVINLIQHSEEILIVDPLKEEDSEKIITEKLVNLLKEKQGGYEFLFDDFRVNSVGIYYIDEEDKNKAIDYNIPDDMEIEFNEEAELTSKKGRIKILYEILPEEEENEAEQSG